MPEPVLHQIGVLFEIVKSGRGSASHPENRHRCHNPYLFAPRVTIETSPAGLTTDTPDNRIACAILDRAVRSRETRSATGLDGFVR
jgi:hypothetical protein